MLRNGHLTLALRGLLPVAIIVAVAVIVVVAVVSGVTEEHSTEPRRAILPLRLRLRLAALRVGAAEPSEVERELLVVLEAALAVLARHLLRRNGRAVLVLERRVGRQYDVMRRQRCRQRLALGAVVDQHRECARRRPLEHLGAPLLQRDHGDHDQRAAIHRPATLADGFGLSAGLGRAASAAGRALSRARQDQRDRLKRLAHAHLVGENAAAHVPLLLRAQPAKPLALVR